MVRRRVGKLEDNSGGPIAQFDELVGDLAQAVLGNLLEDNVCVWMANAERSARDNNLQVVAALWAFERGIIGCPDSTPPGSGFNIAARPYEGGQCPGVEYLADAVITDPFGGVSNTTVRFPQGPVLSVFADPNASGSSVLRYIGGVPEQERVASTFTQFASAARPYSLASIGNFRRSDGQPDNCGSTPLPPPENDEPVGIPPSPPPDNIIQVEQTFNQTITIGGVTADLGVIIGDVKITNFGTIVFDYAGREYEINPDGTIDEITEDELTEDETENNTEINDKLDDLSQKLDDALEDTGRFFDGAIQINDCEGQIISGPYSGEGFAGVESMVNAAVSVLATQSDQFCPIDSGGASYGPSEVISQGTFLVGQVIVVPLPSSPGLLELEINTISERTRIFKLSGDQSSGRFGVWEVATGGPGSEFGRESVRILKPRSSLVVPDLLGLQGYVRLSLDPETQYTLSYREITS